MGIIKILIKYHNDNILWVLCWGGGVQKEITKQNKSEKKPTTTNKQTNKGKAIK